MLQNIIHRPVAVIMTALSVVVVALVFIQNIPISLLPDIPIPRLIVQAVVPSADARTLENTVIRPIRNQLLQVSNVKNIKSRTRNGSATIEVLLEYGTNTDLAQIEINEKLDQVMYLLPRDIKRPKVVKTPLSDIPIYEIAVLPTSAGSITMNELTTFCEREIVRRLEQLDEVALVDIHGYTEPQISVIPDINILQSLGKTEGDLIAQIEGQNAELGNVVLKDGAYEFHVRLSATLASIDDVKNIPIRLGTQTYLLHQIADIKMGTRPKRGAYLYNDQQAIALSIRKQSDANNFKLKKEVDTLMQILSHDYPHIAFHQIKDQSKILKVTFDNLFSSLFYGLLFSSLIMFWFLGNWRTSLIILLVVPVSLLISLLFFYLLDISINMISITGLILGVGLMIDNAIITIENIRQWQKTNTLEAATVQGPQEILGPMISSSLTTIAV
ncbi:MAG TPA: efflux RND transporter permease subunit, partial [Saprospiraceae bacterium]|nr:efflux RND transporter permease subunit [Saprospiraceae bacterium]